MDPDVFSFMKSEPGGPMQGPHRDFSTDDLARAAALSVGCVPGSAIVALEPGTSLRVYSGCFDERDDAKQEFVDIPPGYCIIFRSDLIHSGMSYQVQNYRPHCYLRVGDRKWVPDIVEDTLPKIFSCQYCGHQDTNSGRMRSHRHMCRSNPKAAENASRKRQSEKKVLFCDMCKTKFDRVKLAPSQGR